MKPIKFHAENYEGEAKKQGEQQKIPIPLIEKPSIRIDVDISLRDIDYLVAGIASQLDSEFDFEGDDGNWCHPYDLPPKELQRLREEYLKVDGIPPKLARLSPDSKLSLIYHSERDLTPQELDELVNKILNKLIQAINDLNHPSGWAIIREQIREYASEKKLIDISAIKRILIKGSREEGEKRVLDCLTDMISEMKKEGLSQWFEDFHTLLNFGLSDYFRKLIEEGTWTAEKELTKFLSAKFDEFLELLKDLPADDE